MNKPKSTEPTSTGKALTYRIAFTVLALFLFVASGFSQIDRGVRQKNLSKGIDFKEIGADSILRFPRDTLPLLAKDSGSMAIINKKAYVFDGYRWDTLAGGAGGGGLDTTLANALYVQKTDSTQLLIDRPSGLKYQSQTISNTRPYKVLNSALQLRTSSEVDSTNTIYRMNRDGMVLDYIYDASDGSSADDSVTVIINTGRRYKLYFQDYVLANWFGAKPDDGIDDSYAIQKAMNFAIRNQKTPFVKVLGGVYNVKNVTIYKPKGVGEYDFVSATIEGVSPVGSTGNTTKFRNEDKNSFILNIENGRNCAVRNIDFEGEVGFPPSRKAMLEYTDNDWTSGGTIRNNRFSPQAGLVIDAFHATVSSGNQYPGLSSWYTNSEFEGSSNITIEYCRFFRFIAAILISPNGYTQNGDNISFRHGQQLYNKNFWVSCQTQTRSNSITDLYSVGYTETLINCKDYGYQQGTPPFVDHSNMANVHKYLYKYDGPFGGISFDQCYMEGIYSLGISGDLPAVFTNTEISLIVPDAFELIRPSPVLAQGNKVEFHGGNLQYFDNVYAGGLPFNVNSLVFENARITGGVPFITNIYKRDEVTFSNVEFKNIEQTSWLYNKNTTSGVDISQFNGKHILPGTTYKTDFFNVEYTGIGNKIDNNLMETANIRYRTIDNTGYFVSSNSGRWSIGDMITSFNQGIDWSNDFYGNSDASLGFVYAIAGDTIKINHVPQGIADNASFNLYKTRIPRFFGRTLGTVTTGSNVITNVHHEGLTKTFTGGANIKGSGIPAGAHVTGITDNTITLSMNAIATASNVMLYDAVVKATTTNRDINGVGGWAATYNQPWFVGDEWKNVNGGEPVAGIFNSAGWTIPNSGQPTASYTELRSQDNANHALLNANQVFTNTNRFEGTNTWIGYRPSDYASTTLLFSRSANQNGRNTIQSYGQINQFNDSRDFGELGINPNGGPVSINGAAASGFNLTVNGSARFKDQNVTYSANGNKRTGVGSNDGVGGFLYSYDDQFGRYTNFQFEGNPILFKPKGSLTGSVLIDSAATTFDKDVRVPNGTLSGINGSFTGGILNMQADSSQYSWFANGNGTIGGKMFQRGNVEFVNNFRLSKYAGIGTRVALIESTGNVVAGGIYKSPDLVPYSILTGTSSTVPITAGYVGTGVYFNPTLGPMAAYTLTLPGSQEDNTVIEIHFGGSSSGPGATIVTALTINTNSGADIIQATTPTTAVYGDCISYRFYNNHYYRIK